MTEVSRTEWQWPAAIACFLLVVVAVNVGFITVATHTAPQIEPTWLRDEGR